MNQVEKMLNLFAFPIKFHAHASSTNPLYTLIIMLSSPLRVFLYNPVLFLSTQSSEILLLMKFKDEGHQL